MNYTNKKITKKVIIVLIIFILLLIGYSGLIHFGNMLEEGSPGVNESIKMSKKTGVFVAEYYVEGDSILIFNKTYIHFDEIWVEQKWTVGPQSDPIEKVRLNPYANYCLYMKIPENQKIKFENLFGIEAHFFDKAAILNSKKKELGLQQLGDIYLLCDDFTQLPNNKEGYIILAPSDTTEQNYSAMHWTKPTIVGNFYLIRK
jgi:hypothetical protein